MALIVLRNGLPRMVGGSYSSSPVSMTWKSSGAECMLVVGAWFHAGADKWLRPLCWRQIQCRRVSCEKSIHWLCTWCLEHQGRPSWSGKATWVDDLDLLRQWSNVLSLLDKNFHRLHPLGASFDKVWTLTSAPLDTVSPMFFVCPAVRSAVLAISCSVCLCSYFQVLHLVESESCKTPSYYARSVPAHRDKAEIKCMGSVGEKHQQNQMCICSSLTLSIVSKTKLMDHERSIWHICQIRLLNLMER